MCVCARACVSEGLVPGRRPDARRPPPRRAPAAAAPQVREAQLAQCNYILVVGEKEAAERTVNVRPGGGHGFGEGALWAGAAGGRQSPGPGLRLVEGEGLPPGRSLGVCTPSSPSSCGAQCTRAHTHNSHAHTTQHKTRTHARTRTHTRTHASTHARDRTHPRTQVRTRDNHVHGMFGVDDVVGIMREEKETRSLESIFGSKAELRRGGGAEDGAADGGGDAQ
jgi:hypothetical protein